MVIVRQLVKEQEYQSSNFHLNCMKLPKQKLEGSIIFKNFCIGEKLGTGAFGEIYLAINQQNKGEQYAVKAEPVTTKHPQLVFQAKLYKWLNSEGEIVGIPKVHGMATEAGYNLMLMDLLGMSLEDLFVKKDKKFSVKTVILIGEQLIERIQYMHSRSFLHRDIKPDNLLMGRGPHAHIMYLVDMGLAKKYIKDGKHIPYRDGKELTGTARYASIGTHKGQEQSRRDDIQSIGYVLMYFLRGILPWQNMKAKDTKQKYNMIMNKKISTSLETLCEGYPPQFGQIIKYSRGLKFEEAPDYEYLKGLLSQTKKKLAIQSDYVYDWTKSQVKPIK